MSYFVPVIPAAVPAAVPTAIPAAVSAPRDKILDIGLGVLATGATLTAARAIKEQTAIVTHQPMVLVTMGIIPVLAGLIPQKSHIIHGASLATIFTILTNLSGCSWPVYAVAAVAGGILGFGTSSDEQLRVVLPTVYGLSLMYLIAPVGPDVGPPGVIPFVSNKISNALGPCTIASAAGGAVASLAKRFFNWSFRGKGPN